MPDRRTFIKTGAAAVAVSYVPAVAGADDRRHAVFEIVVECREQFLHTRPFIRSRDLIRRLADFKADRSESSCKLLGVTTAAFLRIKT
jgi:hypothetical protein